MVCIPPRAPSHCGHSLLQPAGCSVQVFPLVLQAACSTQGSGTGRGKKHEGPQWVHAEIHKPSTSTGLPHPWSLSLVSAANEDTPELSTTTSRCCCTCWLGSAQLVSAQLQHEKSGSRSTGLVNSHPCRV